MGVKQQLHRRDRALSHLDSLLLLSAAAFAGALVAGLAGFAFSAVAGAILLHVLPPSEAVPLMMASSIAVQAGNLWALRNSIQWKDSVALIGGGLLGIPLSVYLLHNVDTMLFRTGFGITVALYSAYMLFRPSLTSSHAMASGGRNALIGFGGGLIGGLTAMPGALPTIWCDLHGLPKAQQRGLVQPFIAAMQLFALTLMLSQRTLSSTMLINLAISLPALMAGTALGIFMFRAVNEALFRRIILVILFLSGLGLIV
jgi:uncharacterized membrane protein YfcA